MPEERAEIVAKQCGMKDWAERAQIIEAAIRAAQAEQRRKVVELVRDYASRRLYLNAAEMINDIADAIAQEDG